LRERERERERFEWKGRWEGAEAAARRGRCGFLRG